MSLRANRRPRGGFTLLTTGVCLVGLVGMLGLATDIGRMYIVKSEAQGYADAAALTAALELDGTSAGITRARDSLSASTNQWNMGTTAFSGSQIDFATSAGGPWEGDPSPAAGYAFARVRASATVPLYFIPVVAGAQTSVITAAAMAGQIAKTAYNEGIFPFSPFAHDGTREDFGFTPGLSYTLRWPAEPKVNNNLCAGDNAEQWILQAEAGGGSERGYIEATSAEVIHDAIVEDYMTATLTIGTSLNMTGGNKETERNSLVERINQDTDPSSATYAQYYAGGAGNGRRLIAVPINGGYPGNILLGFGLFFLLPSASYNHTGNSSFCAEFVGSYVQGSSSQGAGGTGAFVVRLVP